MLYITSQKYNSWLVFNLVKNISIWLNVPRHRCVHFYPLFLQLLFYLRNRCNPVIPKYY